MYYLTDLTRSLCTYKSKQVTPDKRTDLHSYDNVAFKPVMSGEETELSSLSNNEQTRDEPLSKRHCRELSQTTVTEGLHIPEVLAENLSRSKENVKAYSNSTPSILEQQFVHLKTLCVRNLPEWTDPEDLKNLFTQSSASGLELMFNATNNKEQQQLVTNIQVIQDPDTSKCVGYAFVEFVDHATASEMLETLSGPNFRLPGSNKILSLQWASGPVNPSTILENYHLYIGNLKPGLSDRSVLRVLKTIHSAVTSVRLLPQEILGLSPRFVDSKTQLSRSELSDNKLNLIDVSSVFYCATTSYKRVATSLSTDEQSLNSEFVPKHTEDSRRWSCGFVRLDASRLFEWKSILRELRAGLNSEAGQYLRRVPNSLDASLTEPKTAHPSVAIILRPMFGKFDDSSGISSCLPRPGTNQLLGQNQLRGGNKLTQGPQPNLLAGHGAFHQKVDEPVGNLERKTTVFIGNLNEETKDEDISMLFSPFGVVLSIRVAFLKHVGFVEMADHRSALAALSHLRGAFFKRHKLQCDWGRSRPQAAAIPRYIDAESKSQHAALIAEKGYAMQWLQSMLPQKATNDAIEQNVETISESDSNKSMWLASLCMSLPKRPEVDMTQNKQNATNQVTGSTTEDN